MSIAAIFYALPARLTAKNGKHSTLILSQYFLSDCNVLTIFNFDFHICIVVLLIYLPLALAGYFAYGGDVQSNIVLNISNGPLRIVAEIMILLHNVSYLFFQKNKNVY